MTLMFALLLPSGLLATTAGDHLSVRVNVTPTVTAAAPHASRPSSQNQMQFLPLIRHPFHIYLPLASFENATPEVSAPFPTQEAERVSLNTYFSWSHTDDPEDDEYWFEVYLEAGHGSPLQLISETKANFLEPSFNFELNTHYSWQVVAVDARGARQPGPIWRFSTDDAPYPPRIGEMIAIPNGEFMMGCDPGNPAEIPCFGEEVPLHAVYLDTYAIDKYEVTNREYRECVNAGVCNMPFDTISLSRHDYFYNPEFDYFPVLYVSKWDADDYCRWQGKRLPTEAEWEKAARGAVSTRVWPWGNEYPDCTRLNFTDNSDNDHWTVCGDYDTTQVGSFPTGASPYGLMDMAGNAFEWVADFYDVTYYHHSPAINPTGPITGTHFTIRGGSYRPNWYYSRTAHRHWGHHGPSNDNDDAPYYRNDQVGFRCARDIEE
jgi:formylglycine-generating enzyme required for sulfatase activity